ncbi:hypothetical protein [Acetobacter sp. DsW_063]|uniref:hypothetical protein n=1 Tax=Acetobacter sp. DsW_063 TaxID=1514894 RepID=UPI000A3C02FB|nr:hypothetical protein [Acetobacter sp. DsW_063]
MSDALWTSRELAAFLRYQESTVRRLVSQHPERLPPRVAGLGRPRWDAETVRRWASMPAASGARRGRPRVVPGF